jgi:hypothetical protein
VTLPFSDALGKERWHNKAKATVVRQMGKGGPAGPCGQRKPLTPGVLQSLKPGGAGPGARRCGPGSSSLWTRSPSAALPRWAKMPRRWHHRPAVIPEPGAPGAPGHASRPSRPRTAPWILADKSQCSYVTRIRSRFFYY